MSIQSFDVMLKELYEKLKDYKVSSNLSLPVPKFDKKPTRLVWNNVYDFLKVVNRDKEHLLKYLKNDRQMDIAFHDTELYIQGKYMKKDLEKIMLEYVSRYVKCPICGSYQTNLTREIKLRKDRIECNTCHSKTFI